MKTSATQNEPGAVGQPLSLLSIVIPARDESGCIASTVKHLHLELNLHNVPHEIIVVDDHSTDTMWAVLQEVAKEVPALRPVQNTGAGGFGRAIVLASTKCAATQP